VSPRKRIKHTISQAIVQTILKRNNTNMFKTHNYISLHLK